MKRFDSRSQATQELDACGRDCSIMVRESWLISRLYTRTNGKWMEVGMATDTDAWRAEVRHWYLADE